MLRSILQTLKLLRIGMLLALSLAVSACAAEANRPVAATPQGAYPIDSTFREFYQLLGGVDTLGDAISPVFDFQNTRLQYTEAVLLKYDPAAQASQRYSLVALGSDLGIQDPPLNIPDQAGVRIVDGYLIAEDFVPLYDQLQGARFVGQPLTQVRVDAHRGRIEQYFSNLGFYRLLSDPPGQVHLLAYGAWKCDTVCQYQVPSSARIAPLTIFPEPLIGGLQRFGSDLTGQPLSAPYLTREGMLEQIYENVVVSADPAQLATVTLRSIPALVGFPATPPVAQREDDRMTFYSLGNGLGHFVPKLFEKYISQHGGMEAAGLPTTEIFSVENRFRQCFVHYCLDYDPTAEEAQRVRPASLGELYLEKYPPDQATYAHLEQAAQTDQLSAWKDRSTISSGQEQTIYIQVLDSQTQKPVPDVVATLLLLGPDEASEAHYSFPPTDTNGASSLKLPAMAAPNGTLIPYQVCLDAADGAAQCVTESYVIWGGQ